MHTKAFTLIEFLIALVIIGFIVAILVGVFSNPVRQARNDSAISQIRDGARQIADAISLSASKASPNCCKADFLVSDGFLTALPGVPAGMGSSSSWFRGSQADRHPGGCGTNSGEPVSIWVAFDGGPISDAFCKEYNITMGLGSIIIGNCADDGCASGATDGTAPASAPAQSFCFHESGGNNTIVYNSGVPGDADLDSPGIAACP